MVMRVCPGGGRDQRRDCVRWLRRAEAEHAETWPVAPWRMARVIDAHGRPLGHEQTCDWLLTREMVNA